MSDTEFDRWFDERVEAYVDGELPESERLRFETYALENQQAAEQLHLARLLMRGLADLPQPACPPGVAPAVLAVVRRESRRVSFQRVSFQRVRNFAHVARPAFIRTFLAVGVLAAFVVAGALLGRVSPTGPAISDRTSGEPSAHAPEDRRREAGEMEAERAGVHHEHDARRDDLELAGAAPSDAPALPSDVPALPSDVPAATSAEPAESSAAPAATFAERAPPAGANGQIPSPDEVERALIEVKWTLAFLGEIGRQAGQSIRREIFDEPIELPSNHRLH